MPAIEKETNKPNIMPASKGEMFLSSLPVSQSRPKKGGFETDRQ